MPKPELNPLRGHLPEYGTQIVILIIACGLLVFGLLTGEVLDGETGAFDRRVLMWFRNPADLSDPIGPESLEVVMRDITALGGVLVLGILCTSVVGYFFLIGKRRPAIFIGLSVLSGTLLNTLLKELISRPRPDIVPHGTDAALSSFPSGHTMMSTVVYLTLGALLAYSTDSGRLKLYVLFWSVALAGIVGISRLYLGVHWPTDILAGWICGATWALFCLLCRRVLVREL